MYVLETDTVKAEDFTATISIRSADGLDELSCRCRPLGLDLTKDKIADSGRGLVFTDKTARWGDILMISLYQYEDLFRLFWEDNKVRYKVVIEPKQ